MKEVSFPTIGLFAPFAARIAGLDSISEVAKYPTLAAGFASHDRILGAEAGGEKAEFAMGNELALFLQRHRDDVVQLDVERLDAEGRPATHRLTLAPRPIREVGFVVDANQIDAIQKSSPAEAAGLQPGDRVIAVDGAPFDPLLLDYYLAQKVGQMVQLTIQPKGKTENIVMPIVPGPPHSYTFGRRGGPSAADALGIALRVTNTIQSVAPQSPAAAAGLLAGDRLQSARFVVVDPTNVSTAFQNSSDWRDTFALTEPDDTNWASIFEQLQDLPPGMGVELTIEHENRLKTVTLAPTDSVSFHADRDLLFAEFTQVRTAATLKEAVALGIRETKEAIQQVFVILARIKDMYRSLGGPGTIAVMATKEASAGIPRLLVFLTMLSANLAVLNFLPIPVLDGGHMVFLAYEGLVGKPVNERIAFGLTMMGLTFILGLMVYVIGMDVYRFGFAG
jgi:regulator of sigma E protease